MSKNIASSVVLLLLSVGYYLSAAAMPVSILDTTVPSSAFPKLLAICGAVLSVALIAQSAVVAHIGGGAAGSADDEDRSRRWDKHKRALGLLAIVLLFVLALEVVGYPVAIALLILCVSRYQGYPISRMSIAIAMAGGTLFYLFFMVLLGIHMPLGIWPQLFAAVSAFKVA